MPEKESMGRKSSRLGSQEKVRLYNLSPRLSSNSFTSVITGARGVPEVHISMYILRWTQKLSVGSVIIDSQ